MLKAKKKKCKTCGDDTYIWARGECKKCSMKASTGLKSGSVAKQRTPLKVHKPPTISYKGKQLPVHTAIYMAAFKYDVNSVYFPSEIDNGHAVDVHHIINRSRAGKDADCILNLMALTREQHEDYGDKEDFMDGLIETHLRFCIERGVNVPVLIEELPESLKRIKNIYYENYIINL